MSAYSATNWPPLTPKAPVSQTGVGDVEPDENVTSPPLTPQVPISSVLQTWAPQAPPVNNLAQQRAVIAARQTRAFFGIVDGVDTLPSSTLETLAPNTDGSLTTTVLKQPQ